MIEDLRKKVKAMMGNDPVFGYPHVERVVQNAKLLADMIGGNEFIVECAALLHDIGYDGKNMPTHAEEGAIKAGDILRELGFTADVRERIMKCVLRHDYNVWVRTGKPATIEEKIISDAENLERCSPQGIIKFVIYASRTPSYKDAGDILRAASNYVFKAFNSLFFEESRKLALKNRERCKEFLEEIATNVS